MQRTIARAVEFTGTGLHTGETGRVTFKPAAAGSGIRFVRTDLPGRPEVDVRPENAHFDPRAGRRTILQRDGVQIHTMEHVLAAIAGLGIDNLVIETSTMEIPELDDGSAAPIARLLCETGYETRTARAATSR
jgi:UDP-3-O-acyl-N-acetylglucosamine deacetylase